MSDDKEKAIDTPFILFMGSDGVVEKTITREEFIESMKGDDVDPEAVEKVLGSVLDDEEE